MNDEDQVGFNYTCENGHESWLTFDKVAFKTALTDGSLGLWCGVCYETYAPSEKEVLNFKKFVEDI